MKGVIIYCSVLWTFVNCAPNVSIQDKVINHLKDVITEKYTSEPELQFQKPCKSDEVKCTLEDVEARTSKFEHEEPIPNDEQYEVFQRFGDLPILMNILQPQVSNEVPHQLPSFAPGYVYGSSLPEYSSISLPYQNLDEYPADSYPPVYATYIHGLSPLDEEPNQARYDLGSRIQPPRPPRSRTLNAYLAQLEHDAIMPNILPTMSFARTSDQVSSNTIAVFPFETNMCGLPILLSCSPQVVPGVMITKAGGASKPDYHGQNRFKPEKKEKVHYTGGELASIQH